MPSPILHKEPHRRKAVVSAKDRREREREGDSEREREGGREREREIEREREGGRERERDRPTRVSSNALVRAPREPRGRGLGVLSVDALLIFGYVRL